MTTPTPTPEELAGLLAKATERPWSIAADDLTECFVINGTNQVVPLWEENDLTMIVALVNAAPDLLARIRVLTEVLEPFAQAYRNAVISGQPPVRFVGAVEFERAALTLNKEKDDGV